MKSQRTFRHPKELVKEDPKEPVSVRIRKSTKEHLEREAAKAKISFAHLASSILDDYVEWLKTGGK